VKITTYKTGKALLKAVKELPDKKSVAYFNTPNKGDFKLEVVE